MSLYRAALVWCRALALALWGVSGFELLSLLIWPLRVRPGAADIYLHFQPALVLGPAALAIALTLAAPLLGAAMTGGGALQGETIAARRFSRDERALARAGAGVLLLILGLLQLGPFALNLAAALARGTPIIGHNRYHTGVFPMEIAELGWTLALPVAQCAVGFGMAFGLGLRRLFKPEHRA